MFRGESLPTKHYFVLIPLILFLLLLLRLLLLLLHGEFLIRKLNEAQRKQNANPGWPGRMSGVPQSYTRTLSGGNARTRSFIACDLFTASLFFAGLSRLSVSRRVSSL